MICTIKRPSGPIKGMLHSKSPQITSGIDNSSDKKKKSWHIDIKIHITINFYESSGSVSNLKKKKLYNEHTK